jgi:hypothetical protein
MQSFARDLHAAVPGLRKTRPRDGEERTVVYEGIGLRGDPRKEPESALDF